MDSEKKKYPGNFRLYIRGNWDVEEAYNYLRNECGYDVNFKIKQFLLNLFEKEKLRQELVK